MKCPKSWLDVRKKIRKETKNSNQRLRKRSNSSSSLWPHILFYYRSIPYSVGHLRCKSYKKLQPYRHLCDSDFCNCCQVTPLNAILFFFFFFESLENYIQPNLSQSLENPPTLSPGQTTLFIMTSLLNAIDHRQSKITV